MSDKEQYYDDVIAPQLLALCKDCEDRGISFFATVEWKPGEGGSTISLQEDHHKLTIGLAVKAMLAQRNMDVLIWYIMEQARIHGHSSLCLNRLGVPETPKAKEG